MNWSPQNESELVDAVRAARNDRRALEIVGHGTKRALGRPVEASTTLDLSAISGIVCYEPDELVITARCATPVREINAAVAERRQCLGFEPADWSALFGTAPDSATIGGVISADANGSARVRFGSVRDHLLGYAGVNGFAETYRAGGRVVKNVTGFDLPKIVCGAMGTLGALTEVTLRLMPMSGTSQVLMVRNADTDTAFELLRRVWSSPIEATGLAYVPRPAVHAFPDLGEVGNGVLLVRLEGRPQSLGEKIAFADSLLKPHEVLKCPIEDNLFARVSSGAAFADRTDPVWRIFLPPASAAPCVGELQSPFWFADWAGGLIWAEGGAAETIHALAGRFGGHAQLMRANETTRRSCEMFSRRSPAERALTLRVKHAFDPLGLFNPGRIFDGI